MVTVKRNEIFWAKITHRPIRQVLVKPRLKAGRITEAAIPLTMRISMAEKYQSGPTTIRGLLF